MLGSEYKDIEDGERFDRIEDALLTRCHICGTELEWELKVFWCPFMELPVINGKSFSCGVTFEIDTDTEGGYITRIVE